MCTPVNHRLHVISMGAFFISVGVFAGFFPLTHASGFCPRFEFPGLDPGLSLTAEEDTKVEVTFNLIFDKSSPDPPLHASTTTNNNNNNDDSTKDDDGGGGGAKCLKNETSILMVTKARGDGGHHEDYCFVRVNPLGSCHSFSNKRCRCLVDDDDDDDDDGGSGGRMRLLFTKRVGKEDEGEWLWWTRTRKGEMGATRKMHLKVVPPSPSSSPASGGGGGGGPQREMETAMSKDDNDGKVDSDNDGSDDNAETTTDIVRKSSPPQPLDSAATAINITAHTATNNNNTDEPNIEAKVAEEEKILSSDDYGQSGDDDDDGDDNNDVGRAEASVVSSSSLDVSYVGAIVAGVNISTAIVVAVVVVIVRAFYCNKRGRRRRNTVPPACRMTKIRKEERWHETSGEYDSTTERISTSSRVYDEICDDAIKTVVTSDTSLYLHPVDCLTTTTPTPTPTATATTSTIITITK